MAIIKRNKFDSLKQHNLLEARGLYLCLECAKIIGPLSGEKLSDRTKCPCGGKTELLVVESTK
jgi:DNA-directed RNA polymerase subunit RPC12/RpoP